MSSFDLEDKLKEKFGLKKHFENMSPKALTRFFHFVEIPQDRKRSLVLGVWEINSHICIALTAFIFIA